MKLTPGIYGDFNFSIGKNNIVLGNKNIVSGEQNILDHSNENIVSGENVLIKNSSYNILKGENNEIKDSFGSSYFLNLCNIDNDKESFIVSSRNSSYVNTNNSFFVGNNQNIEKTISCCVFGDNNQFLNDSDVENTFIFGNENVSKNLSDSHIIGNDNNIESNFNTHVDILGSMNKIDYSFSQIIGYNSYISEENEYDAFLSKTLSNTSDNVNHIFGFSNFLGYENGESIKNNISLGILNIAYNNVYNNFICGFENKLENVNNSLIFGRNIDIHDKNNKFIIGENLFGYSKFELGKNEEIFHSSINRESDYFNLYGGKLVLRVTENQELIAPEQTKEKIANNDLFLVTREYVDPPVISKTPDDEQTITIDFSRERYTTTIPLTTDITKIKAINVKPGQSGKIFIKQDNTGGRKIELIGGRFVWETNEYDDIQPNQTKNWVTIYNYFVYGELTIVLKKEYEFLYNQQLAVNTSLDKLAVNSNGDTLLV